MREVTLDVQKNGDRNRIVTKTASLGELGELNKRVRYNRFGQARVFDATITVTAPIPSDLMGGVAELETES